RWRAGGAWGGVGGTGGGGMRGGWAQPAGTAEAVAGGWRVNGRWPFASGCQHADWMLGLCTMSSEGGKPLVRGVLLPAREWRIEDTSHAGGPQGTGSHHIAPPHPVVPAAVPLDSLPPTPP